MRESRGGAFGNGVATAKLNPLTYYYSAPNLRVRFCNISDKGGTPSHMCFPILTHTHESGKDSSMNPSHSNSMLRHLNIRFTLLKLIYII